MKIRITRRWPGGVDAEMARRFGAELNPEDRPLSPQQLADAALHYDLICPTVSDRIDGAMLDQPNRQIRWLCNYGAGVDHIDLDLCRRLGIGVTNTPDILTEATAELAILLMLMVARRAGEGEREVRAGGWTGWRPTHMVGSQLHGKTLGLVGFGRIGRATARKARGLGMDLVYFSRRRADRQEEAETAARFVPDLLSLLEQSDFVSLHVPGGPGTRQMIGAKEFAAMRNRAFLVNTARGTVVDEQALIDALRKGEIAGAALDVYADEPDIPAALLDLPSVVTLPHLGSATIEARTAMGERVRTNVEAILAGASPPDRLV